MKTRSLAVACLLAVGWSSSSVGQDLPGFFTETYPEHALQAMLEAQGTLEGEEAALDAKTRQLIALGVAAQVPCTYCVHAHTANARAAGASEAEIREAVATAAMVRHWSTVLNGMQYDLGDFKSEYDKLVGQGN